MKKLTLLLMTLAAIFVFAGCSKSPKDAALSWGKAIMAGDLEKANKYSTPESEKVNASLIELAKKGRADFNRFSENVEKAKVEIDGDSAKLIVEGESEPFPLKKIGGKWKADVSKM